MPLLSFITTLLCKAGTGSSIEIVFDRSQWYDCIYCFNYISVVTVSLMLHITIIYLILYHQEAIGLIGITLKFFIDMPNINSRIMAIFSKRQPVPPQGIP